MAIATKKLSSGQKGAQTRKRPRRGTQGSGNPQATCDRRQGSCHTEEEQSQLMKLASGTFRTLEVRRPPTLAIQALHEPYAHLYVGDYFADTLELSAHEHCALRLLLLETWMRGPVGNARLARVAGLTRDEWQGIRAAVLPLLRSVQPRIAESLNHIRAFDGQRLPAADWHIVRSIVLDRDRHTCTYCGSDKQLGRRSYPSAQPWGFQCLLQSCDCLSAL